MEAALRMLSLNGFSKKKVHKAVNRCLSPPGRAARKGEAEGKVCEMGFERSRAIFLLFTKGFLVFPGVR